MKKSLLALAAMGAFAGAAHAQSSVTVSGVLEAGYTSKDVRAVGSTTTNVKQSAITGGHVATPSFTFSGREDLGGGLSAGFFIQEEFDTATGSTETSGSLVKLSQTFVTLSSNQLGSINVGSKNHTTRDIGGVYRFMGDIGRLNGNFNLTNNFGNTVEYVSPAISGFSASVGYGNADKTVTSGADTNVSPASLATVGIQGKVGNAAIGVAHETNRFVGASVGADNPVLTQITAGGSYDFGMAKVGLVYANQEYKLAGGAEGGKRTAMGFHLAAPVTKVITLGASYTTYLVKPVNAAAAEPKADIVTVGAQYAFSKRTSIYGSYQVVTNSGAANALAGVAAGSINGGTASSSRGLGVMETTGQTTNGFGLTAVHTF